MNKVLAALPDALVIAGGSSLSYGASLLHPAAGFITAGALLLAGGFAAARRVPNEKAAD